MAVLSNPGHEKLRKMVEEQFDGPKILLDTTGGKAYKPRPGLYAAEIAMLIAPSEFDRQVDQGINGFRVRESSGGEG